MIFTTKFAHMNYKSFSLLIGSILIALAMLVFAQSCTKSEGNATKCYECTTYHHVPVNIAYIQVSTSVTQMQCGLTDADVSKMNNDTTFAYNYPYGGSGYVSDTITVQCK